MDEGFRAVLPAATGDLGTQNQQRPIIDVVVGERGEDGRHHQIGDAEGQVDQLLAARARTKPFSDRPDKARPIRAGYEGKQEHYRLRVL